MTLLILSLIAAALITLLRSGPQRLASVPTLLRLLPLTAATDLLLSHFGIGPAIAPVVRDPTQLNVAVGLLITLNLMSNVRVSR